MNRYLAVALLLAACGDDSSGTPIDAAVDARPDAPALLPDAPPAPLGHHHYVIDSIQVPTNNTQARDFGFDLNGDVTIDNQLGMVLGTFAGMGLDVQMATKQNIDRGATITLIDLFANDFTTEVAATFATFVGATPMPTPCASAADTTCRRHLAGTATFTITSGAPTNPPLTGAITATMFTSAPGHIAVPLAVFPGTAPTVVNLIGARVTGMQFSATKVMSLKFGGGVSNAEMDAKVYPAVSAGMEAAIAANCTALANPPTCGCAPGSMGKMWLDLADAPPKNCHVTPTEVKENSLFQSLFAPDVSLEGQQAVSVGFTATAVEAGFVAP